MKRYIHIYIDYILYRRFSSLCRFLGIGVADTLESLMKRFIEEHKDQAPLDLYLAEKDGKTQIINFNFNQTTINIIQAKIFKLKPSLDRLLSEIQRYDNASKALAGSLLPYEREKLELEMNNLKMQLGQELPDAIIEASRLLEELELSGHGDSPEVEELREFIQTASRFLKQLARREKAHA